MAPHEEPAFLTARRYFSHSLIEFLSGQVEEIMEEMSGMMNNSVNINRLQTDMEKVLADIEELKDKIRASNGGGSYNSQP